MKLIVLDVDGTLYPGNLGIKQVEGLVKHNILPSSVGKAIVSEFVNYKSGATPREIAVNNIVQFYLEGIKGLTPTEINAVVAQVWAAEKAKLFPFVPKLFELAKQHDLMPLIISGSPSNIISLLARDFGVANWWAAEAQIQGGKYTGKLDYTPGTNSEKARILHEFEAKHAVDWKESVALGDEAREAEVFEMVGFPLVFEPTTELSQLASSKHWPVVDRHTLLDRLTSLLCKL